MNEKIKLKLIGSDLGYDPGTIELVEVDHETDDAWIGWPDHYRQCFKVEDRTYWFDKKKWRINE